MHIRPFDVFPITARQTYLAFIFSKSTIKKCNKYTKMTSSNDFLVVIVDFEHISYLVLAFLSLTLNI